MHTGFKNQQATRFGRCVYENWATQPKAIGWLCELLEIAMDHIKQKKEFI